MRMIVCSDLHFKTTRNLEVDRFDRGMKLCYDYAASSAYKNIDALYIVGDFADQGQEEQMLLMKDALKRDVKPETDIILTMASHEYFGENGEEGAKERFSRIFNMPFDTHKVINGFHCIAVTTEKGCRLESEKQKWVACELKKAAAEDPRRPIFVFQHPHISDTVYGSINWGEDDIYSILMNYPQIVDFSGHSHAPVNDPRSIWQKYFTAHGTGSLSYFELDEFDKYQGTVPAGAGECAQLLIVEADADNRVLIKPLDILSGSFFGCDRLIEKPWDPDSFVYTDARRYAAEKPFFEKDARIDVKTEADRLTVTFDAAKGGNERVDSYTVVIRDMSDKHIVRQFNMTSSYYLYNMPEKYTAEIEFEFKGDFSAEITANGFWSNSSEKIFCLFEA